MPTYQYQCTACGHELEEFQSMTEAPLTRCPSCGTESLARILGGGAGLIFKGTGFYLTDYRKSGSDSSPEKKEVSEKKKPEGKKQVDGNKEAGRKTEGGEKNRQTGKPAAAGSGSASGSTGGGDGSPPSS